MSGAEASEEQLRRIRSVTDAELAHLDLDQLLNQTLDRLREMMKVDTAAVLLLDEAGQAVVATAARGLEEEVRQGVRIPVNRGFAGRIAADAHPVIIENVEPGKVLNPILLEKGITSLLGVPLIVEGEVKGVVHVGALKHRHFTSEDVELLQMVADRIALATSAKQDEQFRAATDVLQQSLLPSILPSVPGVEFAARYAPGEGGVGGDWYDVFVLPDGSVGFALGDVAGRGWRAAVVMDRARTGLRAYAMSMVKPADVLSRLDRLLGHFEDDPMVTAIYGVLDLSRQQVLLSSAGHLPPLLVLPDGDKQYIDLKPAPPLGIGADVTRRDTSVPVPEGSSLFLYTDGLIERRDVPIDQGMERLRQAAPSGSAEEACARIVLSLVGSNVLDDDLALLAMHRHSP